MRWVSRSLVVSFAALSAVALLAAACTRHVCSTTGAATAAPDPDGCARAGCPRFSFADPAGGCTCFDGSVLLAGGCVAPATADAFCGKGSHFFAGACHLTDCPLGQALDVSTGACLPMRSIREVASNDHLSLAKRETLGCKGDRPALLEGGHAACVPDDVMCPRGARWIADLAKPDAGDEREGRCEASPRCDAGEVADGDTGMCLRVALPSRGGDHGARVDVGRWARAVLGADGGAGSNAICAPLALRPSLFALPASGSARVRVSVELFFPDDDVTQLFARVSMFDDTTGQPLSSDVSAFFEQSAQPLFEALRAIGGEASAGTVKTTLRCMVRTIDHPVAVPRLDDVQSHSKDAGPDATMGEDDDDDDDER